MIKCIFTNIKNEHRYLEEWINYHIRLGFNKFILYEDSGSISHLDIIDKYHDIIDIDFYDYVLEKDSLEFKDLTCFKHIIKNYNNIDWIIKLDPDEYIVLPENQTIDDLLYNISDDIHQLTFMWKLYNANGFINEPSHDIYSLRDTYIVPIDVDNLATYFDSNTSSNNYRIGKSILKYKYFLKEYQDKMDSLISPGYPHRFIDTEDFVSNDIFINHYITKSFEEFYNRLKDKGEYNKEYYRKIGDFFVLNPDLIAKIPEIEDKFGVDIFTFKTKIN